MKRMKIFLLISLCALILSACAASLNSISSDIAANTSSSVTITLNDESISNSTSALNAYKEFLDGKIEAIDKATGDTFRIDPSTEEPIDIISKYGFFDLNGDDTQELIVYTLFCDVYSYEDGNVVHWFNSKSNVQGGQIDILENKMIATRHDTTGQEYYFSSFALDGTVTTTFFEAVNILNSKITYRFKDKDVTSEDYDSLTKDYFAAAEKHAEIEWIY